MKDYSWNERGISFEEVVYHLERGDGLGVVNHPNQKKYSHQKMIVVHINEYVYLVPFVENEEKLFLKTVIPSRKATKSYLQGGEGNAQTE